MVSSANALARSRTSSATTCDSSRRCSSEGEKWSSRGINFKRNKVVAIPLLERGGRISREFAAAITSAIPRKKLLVAEEGENSRYLKMESAKLVISRRLCMG